MIDNLEPLRIPGFRVLETGETGETHAIWEREESHSFFGILIDFVMFMLPKVLATTSRRCFTASSLSKFTRSFSQITVYLFLMMSDG